MLNKLGYRDINLSVKPEEQISSTPAILLLILLALMRSKAPVAQSEPNPGLAQQYLNTSNNLALPIVFALKTLVKDPGKRTGILNILSNISHVAATSTISNRTLGLAGDIYRSPNKIDTMRKNIPEALEKSLNDMMPAILYQTGKRI